MFGSTLRGDTDLNQIFRHRLIGRGIALAVVAGLAPFAAGCGSDEAPKSAPMRTAAVDQVKATPVNSPSMIGGSTVGNYLAGRYAQKRRDFATAARLLSTALEADPNNRSLLRRAFMANLAGGSMDEAQKLAKRVVKLDPNAPLASLVLAIAQLKNGHFPAAEKALGEIPPRGLNAFMVPLLTAWSEAGLGQTDKALNTLAKLKEITGFAVIHDLHAALILDLANRNAAAEERYLAVEKGAPRPTVRLIQAIGSFYQRTGRPDEARRRYEEFLSGQNKSLLIEDALERLRRGEAAVPAVGTASEGAAEVFFNVAGTLLQENSIEVALIYGRLAIFLRPQFPLASVLVGRMLESVGRADEAIAVYDGVNKSSPLWWSARLRRAAALETLERDQEAIDQLRQMTDEHKTRSDALASLGDLLRSKKRFSESVEAYDAAIERIGEMGRRHWTLLYSRGISLERSKQWERAEKDFINALELNPDQPYVLNYLGYSWVDQGINLDRARKMIERAVELRPNDGYIVDSLGWVLYRIKEYGGAVKHLERAVELRPQDPTINDHLGDAYWKVGRFNEARFQWRRALSLDPEKDQVKVIQKKIDRGLAEAKAEADAR